MFLSGYSGTKHVCKKRQKPQLTQIVKTWVLALKYSQHAVTMELNGVVVAKQNSLPHLLGKILSLFRR